MEERELYKDLYAELEKYENRDDKGDVKEIVFHSISNS